MKKLLNYLFLSIIIVFISNNYSFGQRCNSSGQSIYPSSDKICINSGSAFYIEGSQNYNQSCDDYGWCEDYWWFNTIVVKRPDGSTALEIDGTVLSELTNWYLSYSFPAGFF